MNFARLAEDMGAVGIRVEKPGEIEPAIAKALEADRPVVIDVVTDIDALGAAGGELAWSPSALEPDEFYWNQTTQRPRFTSP